MNMYNGTKSPYSIWSPAKRIDFAKIPRYSEEKDALPLAQLLMSLRKHPPGTGVGGFLVPVQSITYCLKREAVENPFLFGR